MKSTKTFTYYILLAATHDKWFYTWHIACHFENTPGALFLFLIRRGGDAFTRLPPVLSIKAPASKQHGIGCGSIWRSSLLAIAFNKGRKPASGADRAPLASTERRRDSILISDPGTSRAENDFKGQPLSPQWQPIGKVIITTTHYQWTEQEIHHYSSPPKPSLRKGGGCDGREEERTSPTPGECQYLTPFTDDAIVLLSLLCLSFPQKRATRRGTGDQKLLRIN
ncbi:hypothetical protein NPIL_595531 [Nephila pilipes]|uniref:Uncharacterized protein n=1 Tax=Nephila pilipes TaxID=299642 RepID=A0A8X6N0K2_NEPPI|nr:hypothetical protein NPIL_595531 [Nephila pilipes]